MKTGLLVGSTGQLASDIMLLVPNDVQIIPLSRSDWDLAATEMKSDLSSLKFDFLINTAAITNVDYCESNPVQAHLVNDLAVAYMSRLCEDQGARFIQISTDFVFDGRIGSGSSYDENGITGPINVYGKTKLNAESHLVNSQLDYCIIRTSSLYGHKGSKAKGGNFVSKILHKLSMNEEISIVDDIIMSPTNTADLAKYVWNAICETGANGVFHATNAGRCSWYEFGLAVADIGGYSQDFIQPVSSDFSKKADRPKNSSLSSIKGVEMDYWRTSLERHISST